MSQAPPKPSSMRLRTWVALIVAAAGSLAGLSLPTAGIAAAAIWIVMLELGRPQPSRASRAVAAVFDEMLVDGVASGNMTLIALDLRGVEAETLIDGAAAWDAPIDAVAKRLMEDSETRGARIARFAPHSFALLVPGLTESRSFEMAEHLIVACREPIRLADRVVHIDAVACVRHIMKGERVTGDQLVRSVDASLRLDHPEGSPVTVVDDRLLRRAMKIKDVQREVRNSLDGDLLMARIQPVMDVRLDQVVGLRSAVDWTSAVSTEPEMLKTISRSLGLARAIETQYLLRTISAAENVEFEEPLAHVTAAVDANRLDDHRFCDQIDLLLRVCGLAPENLLLEFSSRGLSTVSAESVGRLLQTGIDIGTSVDYDDGWITVPDPVRGAIAMRSVAAHLLASDTVMIADRADSLVRDLGIEPSEIVVRDVNDAATALELAANGFVRQSGVAHGLAMGAREMGLWLEQRIR